MRNGRSGDESEGTGHSDSNSKQPQRSFTEKLSQWGQAILTHKEEQHETIHR